MRLTYCGPDIPAGSAIPLPEGWPAADHDESDAAVAEAKVASGNYRSEESAVAPRPFRSKSKAQEEITDGD